MKTILAWLALCACGGDGKAKEQGEAFVTANRPTLRLMAPFGEVIQLHAKWEMTATLAVMNRIDELATALKSPHADTSLACAASWYAAGDKLAADLAPTLARAKSVEIKKGEELGSLMDIEIKLSVDWEKHEKAITEHYCALVHAAGDCHAELDKLGLATLFAAVRFDLTCR